MIARTTRWAEVIRRFGEQLTELQRPIRILRALRWPPEIKHRFLAAHGRELPRVDRDVYAREPLPFDPVRRLGELRALESRILRQLGYGHPAGELLARRCRASQSAISLLLARGAPNFTSRSDECYEGATPVDSSRVFHLFARLAAVAEPMDGRRSLSASELSPLLSARLCRSFPVAVPIRIESRMAASAAACGGAIRLKRDSIFSEHDAALFEAHECWIHLGLRHNGRRQSVCKFAAQSSPATTATQEGLAVLCEILAGTAPANRLSHLLDRFRVVQMARDGAGFLDVYGYYLTRGRSPDEAYELAVRVFRGSLPSLGPFTKDAAYAVGLTRVVHSVRRALTSEAWRDFLLILSGKFDLAERPLLLELARNGLIEPPVFVPPPFRNGDLVATTLGKVM